MKPTSLAPLLLLLSLPAAVPAAADVNRIVLRVNDRIATQYDYELRRNERVATLQRAENLSPQRRQELLAEVGPTTMQDLYEELLLLSRADQMDIRISGDALERAMERSKASFGFESDEQFEAALATSGMTLDDFREQMLNNLKMREVLGREVQSRIALEEEDLRRYYRSHQDEFVQPQRLRLREVVVLDSSGLASDEMVRLGLEIQAGLAAGKEPEELVETYSAQGLTTGPIDLGWIKAGDLEADLQAAVWDLGAGEVSSPVPGRGGLHVLQVMEREEPELLPFADVRDRIEGRERERLFQSQLIEYMEELERKAHVVSRPPPEAAGFLRSSRREGVADDLVGFDAAAAAAEEADSPAEPPAGDEPEPVDAAPEPQPDTPAESPSDTPADEPPDAPSEPTGGAL